MDMEERKLRSAKMYFKHKVDIEKFKKETFEKLDRNIHHHYQSIMEERRKKNYPKWMLASVASAMIIFVGLTFGGSYIADAAETLINQLFGSRENLMQAYPNESKEEVDILEQTLAIAKENLTEEEFNHYSQLLQEQTEIFSKVEKENREYPNDEEEKRLDQIQATMRTYEIKFVPIQAQLLASFPFTKPTYIPEGYKQVDESYPMRSGSEEPVVLLNYSNGECEFSTQQVNMSQKVDLELGETDFFGKSKTYSLNGFQFEYVSSKEEWPWDGMRVTVPEKGYKIIITADGLSKGDMEKVLFSMIEK
jgi:succinate dehydrogenase flavin-adding protein (antitoxin of CptAB toxin-antitoxin module)